MAATLSSGLAAFMLLIICSVNGVMAINVSAESQPDKVAKIQWGVDQWSVQARPFWPLSFGNLINFTSNTGLQNAHLVLSSEVDDVLKISDLREMNITSTQVYYPSIIFYMPPGTSTGWHNGTIGVEVNGEVLHDKLPLNIFVPKIEATSQATANGTITYMFTQAYSPYSSNVGDVAIWFTFLNGTSVPMGNMHDVLDNRGGPTLTIRTDSSTYDQSDEIIIVSGTIKKETITEDYATVYVVIYNEELQIPHQYHAEVPLGADGTYSHVIAVRGNIPTDGNYTVSALYRGQTVETSVTISEGVIGDFRMLSQGIPTLEHGIDTVFSNLQMHAQVGLNYTLKFYLKSDEGNRVTSSLPIVEIRNSDGVTEELFVNPGFTKKSFDRWYVTAYWLPKYPDTYSVNTFIISDLERPAVLTAVKTTYFEVE